MRILQNIVWKEQMKIYTQQKYLSMRENIVVPTIELIMLFFMQSWLFMHSMARVTADIKTLFGDCGQTF